MDLSEPPQILKELTEPVPEEEEGSKSKSPKIFGFSLSLVMILGFEVEIGG